MVFPNEPGYIGVDWYEVLRPGGCRLFWLQEAPTPPCARSSALAPSWSAFRVFFASPLGSETQPRPRCEQWHHHDCPPNTRPTSQLQRLRPADRLPADVSQRRAQAQAELAEAKTLSETCAEQQVRVVRKALMQ